MIRFKGGREEKWNEAAGSWIVEGGEEFEVVALLLLDVACQLAELVWYVECM